MTSTVHQELEERLRDHYRERKRWQCGQDVALARYVANDMGAEERTEFSIHLDGCPHCQEALAEDRRQVGVWDAAEPERTRFWARRLFFPGLTPLSLAAAAALLLCVLVWWRAPWRAGIPDSRLQAMGHWELSVVGQRQGRLFRITSGMPMEAGDRLGFFYSSAREGQLLILFADAAGAISVLYPSAGRESARVAAGNDVRLPDGGVLTQGQGCEWILGLFSERPIREAAVRGPIQSLIARRNGCDLVPEEQGKPVLPGIDLQWLSIRRGT